MTHVEAHPSEGHRVCNTNIRLVCIVVNEHVLFSQIGRLPFNLPSSDGSIFFGSGFATTTWTNASSLEYNGKTMFNLLLENDNET